MTNVEQVQRLLQKLDECPAAYVDPACREMLLAEAATRALVSIAESLAVVAVAVSPYQERADG